MLPPKFLVVEKAMRLNLLSLMLALAIGVTACSSNRVDAPPPGVTEIMSPAGAGSEESNLSAAPDGRLFMTWLEPAEPAGNKLVFSVRDPKGGAWSAPRVIATGDNWFVNEADFPSMTVLSDGSLAAHWLGNNEPG